MSSMNMQIWMIARFKVIVTEKSALNGLQMVARHDHADPSAWKAADGKEWREVNMGHDG